MKEKYLFVPPKPRFTNKVVDKKELKRLREIPERTLYLNLTRYHKAQEAGGILFTPAIPAYYALDVALDELIEETVTGRIKRYAKAAQLLRTGFREIGLEFLIPENWQSNCLTSLHLPRDLNYEKLHDELKTKGFVIYAGQGNLSENIFRVANMGDITHKEFERFLKTLESILL